jgi:hypothetical protein
LSDRRFLTELDAVDEVGSEGSAEWKSNDLTFDKRIFFFPNDSLLVTIPLSRDSLVLRKMSIAHALAGLDDNYLVVTSLPSRTYTRGETFTYQISVLSKRGGIHYHLDNGPQGMTLSPTGSITWPVPADYAPALENVIVDITDASGKEVLHSFEVHRGK